MKRLYFLLFLLLSVPAFAAIGPAAPPSGSCPTNGVWEPANDGNLYECVSGTWTKVNLGSLPTATAAGQAPVSTGAGTNYTAQPIPSISGSVTQGEPLVGNASGQLVSSGVTLDVSQFSGATLAEKWNACNAAVIAAGGGTCDARAMGGIQTPDATLQDGSHALIFPAEDVTFILPNSGTWIWNLTGGTACGIEQFSNTTLRSDNTGGAWAGLKLEGASSSTDMDSLYCTDPSPVASVGGNVRAEGFFADNANGSTFANGLLDIQHLDDNSKFSNIIALNPTGDAIHISNVCCGDVLDGIQALSGIPNTTQAGGTPLTISGDDTDLIVENSTFNGPGVGHYNIYIDPTSQSYGFFFRNVYEEKYGTDTATAMNYIGADAVNVQFTGGLIVNNCTASCAQWGFENHTTYGFGVHDLGYGWYSTDGIDDIANSITIPSDGYTINDYTAGNGNAGNFYATRLTTSAVIGFGTEPTLAITTGTGSLAAGSTNIAGVINSTTAGTFAFNFTWAVGAGGYPDRAVCTFVDETTHNDVIQATSSTKYQLFASGTTASGDAISYLCAGY